MKQLMEGDLSEFLCLFEYLLVIVVQGDRKEELIGEIMSLTQATQEDL